MKTSSAEQEEAKRRVAVDAAALVRDGMRLGLGSGSTVALIVAALGERVRRGELRDLVVAVASSQTEAAMERAGLAVSTLDDYPQLDLAIDGADEIDGDFQMIKGGGGALLRERIVLAAATERVIVVDRSKVVPVLGTRWAVPVEVVRFGWRVAERLLVAMGALPTLRHAAGQPMLTDEGNYILDCMFGPIPDPRALAARISALPGVVAHGIFIDLADRVLVGDATSTTTLVRPPHPEGTRDD
jgi:ribose 5-phosphate isomerase A